MGLGLLAERKGCVTFNEVYEGIFQLEIPFSGSPLKAVNSYLIRGRDRSLLVDTGMNQQGCLGAMRKGLDALGVGLDSVDFFITHFHPDHAGLVPELAQNGARIYLSHVDARVLQDRARWTKMAGEALLHGFPEDDVQTVMTVLSGRSHPALSALDFTGLHEGDYLSCGRYGFICIETPGHTRGHLCLYEARARFLISGDHILGGITPNISGFLYGGGEDALQKYIDSLRKMERYDADWVFPGHRAPFRGLHRRVVQIKGHHDARAAEVLSVLTVERQTAYDVAARMSWNTRGQTWNDVAPTERWFACGEALAHLEYLRGQGQVGKETQSGRASFGKIGVRP
jgi:glyoxylase-like metal-dependent hydrolase (beta-lactamase superfamily II)